MRARWIFYNVDNNRDQQQVTKELRALTNNTEPDLSKRPAVLGLCETGGYDLPGIEHYHLVRDRTTPSRGNISAYVRMDLWGGNVKWVDLSFTWPKTQGPGTHEPRSYVGFDVGAMRCWVYHAPPKNAANSKQGQQEGIDSLTGVMGLDNTTRPVVALADWNRTKSEDGPGPKSLAHRVDGATFGGKIDAAVKRGTGAQVDKVEYVTSSHGVKLKSDHGHAFRCRLTADASWWKP